MVELRETRMGIHLFLLSIGRERSFLCNPTPGSPSTMSSFSNAHRLYVKSLYRRFLTDELDWAINRQEWRARAMSVRAEFERNRFALPTLDETGFTILTARTQKRSRPESFG
jgi:hypothetical protein